MIPRSAAAPVKDGEQKEEEEEEEEGAGGKPVRRGGDGECHHLPQWQATTFLPSLLSQPNQIMEICPPVPLSRS